MGGPNPCNGGDDAGKSSDAAEAQRTWFKHLMEHERSAMQAHLDQHYALVRKDIEHGYEKMFQRISQQAVQTFQKQQSPLSEREAMSQLHTNNDNAHMQAGDPKKQEEEEAMEKMDSPTKTLSKKEEKAMRKTHAQLQSYMGIKTPPKIHPGSFRGRLEAILSAGNFDALISILIICNTFITFLSLQLLGHEADASLGLRYTPWPGAQAYFEIIELIFSVIFLVEMLLRIFVYRIDFLYKLYNIVDVIVVPLTCLDTFVLTPLQSETTNVSFVRIVRIVRVVRAVRIIRTMGYFKELRILLNTIAASCLAVCWGMVLLLIVQLMAAILLCQTLHDFIVDDTEDLSTRQWVNRKYGDGAKALWTVFEMTFSGGWPGFVTPIVEGVSPLYAFIFIPYVVVVVFAVIRIVSALFLKETLAQASQEAEQMVRDRMKDVENTLNNLNALFQAADTSGDGHLNLEELTALVSHERVKLLLGKLGVDAGDSEALFHVLDDDNSGHVPREEFISGIKKVKGEARSMDLIPVANHTKQILKQLESLERHLRKEP